MLSHSDSLWRAYKLIKPLMYSFRFIVLSILGQWMEAI